MDIFILSEGQEIGPFSEETAQTLMNQGSVGAADLAWRPGMEDWAPLGEILPFGNELGSFEDESGSSGSDFLPLATESTPVAEESEPLPDESESLTHEFQPLATESGPFATDSEPLSTKSELFTSKIEPIATESAPADDPLESPSPAIGSLADPKSTNEPATAKQKAFLEYLAIGFPEDLSKEEAAALLADAMEDPALAERMGKWSVERLQLHPNLFAAEIHARRENRANHFFEICQTEGAQFFTRITKAHCQVLVSFLDAKFPTWDSRLEDAATNYFFPAIAEKFPQLVEREWKGQFHYAEGLGNESAHKSPTTRFGGRPVTAIEAVLRGFAIGVAILAALYFAHRMIPGRAPHPSTDEEQYQKSAPTSS